METDTTLLGAVLWDLKRGCQSPQNWLASVGALEKHAGDALQELSELRISAQEAARAEAGLKDMTAKHTAMCDRMCAAERMVHALRSTVIEWISLTEQRPGRYKMVLTSNGLMSVSAMLNGADEWADHPCAGAWHPTHWAEMPVSPVTEGE